MSSPILPTPAGYDPEEVEQAQILTRDRVLKKTLEWQNLRAAGLIDQEDLHLIQLYDHKPIAEKISLFRDVSFITGVQGNQIDTAIGVIIVDI
jgi:hypothetical protein